jgi:phage recombination protein Bet
MAANGKPGQALAVLASRLQVSEVELKSTLVDTVFKKANDSQMTALCIVANEYGLNPFVRELFAFPSQNGIVPMVSIDGWLRIINEHPQFAGMDIVYADATATVEKSKECPEYIEVTIHRSDRPHTSSPIREYLDECYRDTIPWNTMTRRMLRHKAIKEAGRVVMGLHGIFDEDEAADVLAREGKRIVKHGDEYDVIDADPVESGEVIGAEELDALKAEMYRVGVTEATTRKNLELKAKYTGELADMPVTVYEALMSGLRAMKTVNEPKAEKAKRRTKHDAQREQAAAAEVTQLRPDPATPEQLAEIDAKAKAASLYDAEFASLIDQFGDYAAPQYGLNAETAGYVLEALHERAGS